MKIKVIKLFLIAIFALTLLSCKNEENIEDLDFSNPDIYAYINDIPIWESDMEQYIQMKTAIMGNYETDPYGMLDHQNMPKSENILYSVFEAKALKYNKSDKVKDYYEVVAIKYELDTAWEEKPEYFNIINTAVDENINDLLLEAEHRSNNPLIIIFREIASENNVTVKEVVEHMYRPYLTSAYEYEGYYKYFLENIYSGEVKNIEEMTNYEYVGYYLKLISDFDHYLEQILHEKYTITYRPTSMQN